MWQTLDTKRNLWMAFDLVDGQILNERVFFDATSIDRPGLADGMKVNKEGYVFATGPGGVLVLTQKGNT